jgi:hypothetical protein
MNRTLALAIGGLIFALSVLVFSGAAFFTGRYFGIAGERERAAAKKTDLIELKINKPALPEKEDLAGDSVEILALRKELEKAKADSKFFAAAAARLEEDGAEVDKRFANALADLAATKADVAKAQAQAAAAIAEAQASAEAAARMKDQLAKLGAKPKEPAPDVTNSKVTRANYDKIKVRMTLYEVEKILGKGKEESASGATTYMVWQSGKGRDVVIINITFELFYPGGGAMLERDREIYTTVRSKSISGD